MRTITTFFRRLLYAAATQDERLRYDIGKTYGHHCSYRHDSGFFPGQDVKVKFIKGKKPEREYLTMREFFALYQ